MNTKEKMLEATIENLLLKIDYLESYSDKKNPTYWNGVCPDYKTVEQFDIFIDSRKKDIDMIQKSINDAEFKKSFLVVDNHKSYYRDLAKKFLGLCQ